MLGVNSFMWNYFLFTKLRGITSGGDEGLVLVTVGDENIDNFLLSAVMLASLVSESLLDACVFLQRK